MRLYHQSIGDLKDMMENVAYMSSPLMRANRHSEVLASDRNWRNQARHHDIHAPVVHRNVHVHTLRYKKFRVIVWYIR